MITIRINKFAARSINSRTFTTIGVGTNRTCTKVMQHRLSSISPTCRLFSSTPYNNILHYEWIAEGKVQKDPTPSASGLVLFLHGLLGNGKNLRTMIKKTTELNPHLQALVLDLRGHGLSGPQQLPHTFMECSKDVERTLDTLRKAQPLPPLKTVIGHSWGGRIALQFAYNMTQKKYNLQPPPRTWLLDTVPGVAHSSVHHVLDAIKSIQLDLSIEKVDKKGIVQLLLDQDLDISMAQWLASSVKVQEHKIKWGFDVDVVDGVLPEFATHDFYGTLDKLCQGNRVDLVRSGQNEAWTEEAIDKLHHVGGNGFHLHMLPNAGHWVHVDDLPGLLDTFQAEGLE
mmetsp:Transcript_17556/g.24398  ORF Transcript_17556/g.24398 Transcript_17556/m.24398 type:complete len:342 (+) Transcript_17556:150-1175(+)